MRKIKQIILIVFLIFNANKIFAQDSLRFFPNPFGDSTLINFDITQATKISIVIYNRWGQEVSIKFKDTFLQSGTHSFFFGATLPKAIYFVKYIVNSTSKNYTVSKSATVSAIAKNSSPKNSILIYPNPTGGNVNINITNSLGKILKVNIHDNIGRQVFTNYYSNTNIQLKMNEFDSGIYTISIPELNYNYKLILIK